ncbi:MAG: hypothetical protein AAGD06_18700 [Acidobacteriota bacterium]
MFRKTFPILVVLLTVLLPSSAAVAQPPFTNTTIVNGNLTPIANGAALLAAVAAATPPALIKVEPGTYDLNGGQLVMQDLVDVEGSGRDVTFVISDVSSSPTNAAVTVPSGVTAELRGLTVRNTASSPGTGVRIESDTFLLTGINVETEITGGATGVETVNCSTVIDDVFVRIGGTGPNAGFRLNGGSPILKSSFAFVITPSWRNVGLEVLGNADTQIDRLFALVGAGGDDYGGLIWGNAKVQLRNTRLTAIASDVAINPYAFGLFSTGNTDIDIKESTFTSMSDTRSVALLLTGNARVKVSGSTFIAKPFSTPHIEVRATQLLFSANLDSNQSNFESTAEAVTNSGAGTARFGASQLVGSVSGSSPTSLQCIFSYNGSYTARAANCL